jgi:hypothetical protein
VGRHSLGDDQQLTYWAQRYVLRSDPTYAKPDRGAPQPPPGAFDGGGLDVPAFLWPCRDAVLTTGGRASAGRGPGCLGLRLSTGMPRLLAPLNVLCRGWRLHEEIRRNIYGHALI